jgi:omega-hydroxy-beta-dihydromenaquinone-9 sulfotransferase
LAKRNDVTSQSTSLDRRYAYPNFYQAYFPHTFLRTEEKTRAFFAPAIPPKRLHDNVAQGFDLPNEDEFAIAIASRCSPYMLFSFPRSTALYERYLTFRDVPEADIARWKEELLRYTKKLTYRHKRPLLLRSPPHTGRVRLLLELFPGAKFIHVYRNPYAVFASTRHLNDVLTKFCGFQLPDPSDRDDGVIRRYKAMHDAYVDQRGLIPKAISTNWPSKISNAIRSVNFRMPMSLLVSVASKTCAPS